MKVLATKKVPIEQLVPFPGNARNGDTDIIGESLSEHGQYRAIVVWASDGAGEKPMQVLAGNHTYMAAGEKGYGSLLCHMIECDADEAVRINLVDNRANDVAGYDKQMLADQLQSLGGDMGEPGHFAGTGYNIESLNSLLERITADESKGLDPPKPTLLTCPECGHEGKPGEFKGDD